MSPMNRTKVGRERVVAMTHNRAEQEELKEAARRAGKSLSEYVLDAALGAARGTLTLGPPLAAHIEEAATERGLDPGAYLTDLLLRDARGRVGA